MRVIFYTGKGGSGKSVISCATALKSSEIGYKTLVISSDPAHTISDAFEMPVKHVPTKIANDLWALQVDPLREVKERYGVIQEYMVSLFKSRGLDEILAYEIASLPSMTELAALLKIVEFMELGEYDVIVLDTVPSGEALKNIYLPTLLGSVATKLIKLIIPFASVVKVVEPIVGVPTPSKEVISEDIRLIEVLKKLKDIIIDRNVTSLRLVANPDAFSIQNLRRTYLLANLYNINVDLAIMNKIIPELVKDAYFDQWKNNQRKYLIEAELAFHPLPIKRLRLFKTEIRGLKLLSKLGNELFRKEDPTKVYYRGKPIKMREFENGFEIIIPTPFINRDLCEVERIGGDLSIVVQTDIGEIRNFIPLPAIAHVMKLDKAKLLNGELHIYFIKEK